MLPTIRTGTSSPSTDPLAPLLECHVRIRRFCAIAAELAAGLASPSELSEAAIAVHRYFVEALPLHASDEDDSLAPRLRAAGCDPATLEAVAIMEREHQAIEAAVAQLLPVWLELHHNPSLLQGAELCDSLATRTAQLTVLFEQHLGGEESRVFPAARALLTAEQFAELHAELRARRQPEAP